MLVVALATTGGVRAMAQDGGEQEKVAKLTAAFVLNFIRYAEWPESAFEDEAAPVRVAVVGQPPMLRYLRLLTSQESVDERRVIVEMVPPPDRTAGDEHRRRDAERFATALRRSHVLFVPAGGGDAVPAALDAVADRPVLTISDTGRFVDRGGMLELYVSNQRMVFDANRDAIRRVELKMSSAVLRLAQRVLETRP